MPGEVMQAPESGVTVRMYRTGLGDCFLLAFRGRDGSPVYMLIDCGVHGQYKGGGERIGKIAEHIQASVGQRLHVVAVTHEHADHISGFDSAREVFLALEIGEAWLGWTEKPGDPEAGALKTRHSMMLDALVEAQQKLAAADPQTAEGVEGLLGFFGARGSDALNVVRERAKEAKYFKPKCAPLRLPGVDGVRVFVLGPPEDRRSLMSSDPTGKAGQVYEEDAFAAALMAAEGALSSLVETAQPFAGNYRVPVDLVQERKDLYGFFHEHYGFGETDAEAWRRIDSDWRNPSAELALKLDSATNNTSLVLAIELEKSGRVLLFPGDAQVGSWASWHEGGWTEENGLARGETITAKNLLNRTVLYKVGHHGSHNATLKDKGLELMVSEELTAMIPVDESWALERKPNPWRMPFGPLYEDLERRTKGRILRSDRGATGTGLEWKSLRHQPRFEDLYVELTIADD